jgi:hypothetical protein
MVPDQTNAAFELAGGLVKLIDIHALYRDKQVNGISLIPFFFFISWALWNCFYYPMIHQPWSFAGGIFLFFTNSTWLIMALYYKRLHK